MRFVDVEAHAHEMQVGSQTCKSSARALGAARLLKKLPAHFDSERFGAAKGRALVVDVRTRRSVPISAAGDAAASSLVREPNRSIRDSGPRIRSPQQRGTVSRTRPGPSKPARAILKPNNNDSDAAAPGPATL